MIKKKSTIGAFVILFAFQVIYAFSGNFGSTYVDGEFYETLAECNRKEREYGVALSGRSIDNELLMEMREEYAKVDWADAKYPLSQSYSEGARKYIGVDGTFRMWGLKKALRSGELTEEMVYEARQADVESTWDYYKLNDKERKFWQKKEAELKVPFTYQYAMAWEYLTEMQGCYMVCMFFTFFISIAMVNVFGEEHSSKTDQLILSSQHGREKIYIVKILAGSIVTFFANLLFIAVMLVGYFFTYGIEGFGASIQVAIANFYSYDITVGETTLIMIGLLLLSSIMTAIFTMVLAEILKNSVATMAIVIGILFGARIIKLPVSWGLLAKSLSYIPINLLKVDEGFMDLRLVSVLGVELTTWQFAPFLYVVIIAILVVIGRRTYMNFQVTGR